MLLAVAVPLAAQTTGAAAPPLPHILIDTVGPDGWRVRLGPTNLGKLLASEKGRAVWQPGVTSLLGAWQQLLGDEKEFAAARDRLLAYGGRVRLAIVLRDEPDGGWPAEPASRSPRFVNGPIPRMALVLDSDGRTDMNALAADLRKLQDRIGGEWQKETVDGTDVDVIVKTSERIAAPELVGDQILLGFAVGSRIADAMALGKSVASAAAVAEVPTTAVLRVDVDVPTFAAGAAHQIREPETLKLFGFTSLGTASLSVGTAGQHVQFEVAQSFADRPAGIFAALCPTSTAVPNLQALIGDDATTWRVGRFDWLALYRASQAVAFVGSDATPEEIANALVKRLGIEPEADLLAHVTDEMLFELRLGDLDRIEDAAWVMFVGLRDTAAFDKSLRILLEHAKPALTRAATTKVGDVDMHRYGLMFGYDLWLAVAHGRLLVAGGRGAEETLSTCLAKAADKERAARTPASDAFRELRSHLPPGNNGFARGDLDSVLTLPVELWFGLLPRMLGNVQKVDAAREAALELLRTHDLAMVRTATGYAERTWRWRLYW